ncbi:MAG: formate dehydrogenase subunit delta, partial [Arenicella sp.]
MNAEYLMKMLEQIAANLAYEKDEDVAAAMVARHIQSFWTKGMKTALVECVQAGAEPEGRIAALA